jgi:hypothetical protein
MSERHLRPLAVGLIVLAFALATPLVTAFSAPTAPSNGSPVLGSGTQSGTLLVRFRSDSSRSAASAALAAAGAREIGRLDQISTRVVGAAAGQSTAGLRQALAANPAVEYIEDDDTAQVTLTPDDTYWSNEWFETKVRADRAWNITTGTGGPVIAVLDTGVKASLAEFSGRILPGYDFVNNDADPADDMGHGTKVSGVVAALGNNTMGIAGTCWDCRILPVKVADLNGNVTWANAAAGLIWATDNGAKVVNMSFGKSTGSSTMAAAVDYAHSHGVVVIAAAGNEGNTAKFYPAAYAGVLSVAATTSTDSLYSWSTRGTWVKLSAPGCSWTTFRNGTYGSFCGTSASAPLVAGIAGLVLAYKPDATQTQVEDALRTTAVNINVNVGGGRVDAYAAVHLFEPKKGGGHGH